ncbi:MAG: polysaccharide pyruvyl transferase family protein [bacterium]
MNKKYASLNSIIFQKLTPILNNDYIFLDLPYFTNIGDTLIWKGTEEFLKTLPHKCLYRSSIETYSTPRIGKNVTILLQGGGNFGDIWRRHTEFCLRILRVFPDNQIIVLPQTIYYNNEDILKQDAQEMTKHKHLTICARDFRSYEILKKQFPKNQILQLPDMAFCIGSSFLQKHQIQEEDKVLFFKRKDIEFAPYDFSHSIKHPQTEEHEWPSMEYNLFVNRVLARLKKIQLFMRRRGIPVRLFNKVIDLYSQNIFMPHMLKIGIQFISKYKYVYSTRLHGAILSILLDKPLTLFDNSYGKNDCFYQTWLKDTEKVEFIKQSK